MLKKLSLAAALAATMSGGPVSATAFYLIDDFLSAPPNPFSATLANQGQFASDGPDSYTIGGLGFTRSVLFENVADTSLIYGASINISGGDLKIVNGTNVRSRTTLTYNVQSLKPVAIADSWSAIGVTFSNGTASLNGPTTIQAFLRNSMTGDINQSLGTLSLQSFINQVGGTTSEYWGGISLLGSQLTGVSDILTFVINGPADYDLTLDQIDFAVPEPAMLGLFGAGFVALGIARRRKR